ncbi:hypothetical protein BV898_00045 [Hypsibius exemplaris]|uniref:Uncharacterized protein n=1 Tax=Hypsibius exemplaris TaxID=2072580 RepID=A0A1W0XEW0_HYPEX|nr:hypothetical protein BV898_00045 [Hypsibius exemplaris]
MEQNPSLTQTDLTERQQLYQDLGHFNRKCFAHLHPRLGGASSDGGKHGKISTLQKKSALLAHLDGNLEGRHLLVADRFLTDLSGVIVKMKNTTDAFCGDCKDNKRIQLTRAADLLHAKMEQLLEFDRLAVQLKAP